MRKLIYLFMIVLFSALSKADYISDLKEIEEELFKSNQNEIDFDPSRNNSLIEKGFNRLVQEDNPILKGKATQTERIVTLTTICEMERAYGGLYHKINSPMNNKNSNSLPQAELMFMFYTASSIKTYTLVTVDYNNFLKELSVVFLYKSQTNNQFSETVHEKFKNIDYLTSLIPHSFIIEFYKRNFDRPKNPSFPYDTPSNDVATAMALQNIHPRISDGYLTDCDFTVADVDNNLIKITRSDKPESDWQTLLLNENKPQVKDLREFFESNDSRIIGEPYIHCPYQIIFFNGYTICSINSIAFLVNPKVKGRLLTTEPPFVAHDAHFMGSICYGFEKTDSPYIQENWSVIDRNFKCNCLVYQLSCRDLNFLEKNELDGFYSFLKAIHLDHNSSASHDKFPSKLNKEVLLPSQAYGLYQCLIDPYEPPPSQVKISKIVTQYLQSIGLENKDNIYDRLIKNCQNWRNDITRGQILGMMG